ncbi:PIN domain-containing protein [Spiractinospora alimapuensis]|uniref:type II toxin-antitoxin system VapC family toxin n=1 Tax=Spiractinospora alimapuensis TaxID=2820884 RepID=UPI001F2594AC|nr:PIN domain-containing protein [Spiractinospora alimapuensis]QVQ50123.1 PIN domain-containing protein [Spiractinospora alimapuensis]
MILLDTHVVVWLYKDPLVLVPDAVLKRLDVEEIGLSPVVNLELQYLYEIGRLNVPSQEIINYLAPRLELTFTDPSSMSVFSEALSLQWTRDPFDRLLAAHAASTSSVLVTKDRKIRENLEHAWWPAPTE